MSTTSRAAFQSGPTSSAPATVGSSARSRDAGHRTAMLLSHSYTGGEATTGSTSSIASTPAPIAKGTGGRRPPGSTRYQARDRSSAAVDHVAREQFSAAASDGAGRVVGSTSLASSPFPAAKQKGSGRFTAAQTLQQHQAQDTTRGGGAGLPQYQSPASAGRFRDGMYVAAAPPYPQQPAEEALPAAAAAAAPPSTILGGGKLHTDGRRVQSYVRATENFHPGRHDARRTCPAAADHVADNSIMSSPAAPPPAPKEARDPRKFIPHYHGGTTRYAAARAGRCAVDSVGPAVKAPPPVVPSEDMATVLFGGYE